MTPEQYVAHVEGESARFARFAQGALDTPVTHLGWTVRDLVGHLGSVYCYAASNAAAAIATPADLGPEARPAEGDELPAWFGERQAVLLDTLRNLDDDATGWTHAGPQRLAWWKRRMACETAIHRWDLEAAVRGSDEAQPIDSDLATDAINEYLETSKHVSVAQPGRNIYPASSLHLHRTDGPGEWMLVGDGQGGLTITEEHGKGDAAVRGPASDLLLWTWGRPINGVEIFGDETIASAWQQLAP